MIAIDTNILVYAHRADMVHQRAAFALMTDLLEGEKPWALPWPCVHEFFASVTAAKWKTPTSPAEALKVLKGIEKCPRAQFIGEGVEHLETLSSLVMGRHVRGGAIHDARIAAICLAHGVNEIWTADRDFSRFPELKTYNPFQATHGRHRH